jgi:hypothetical protein
MYQYEYGINSNLSTYDEVNADDRKFYQELGIHVVGDLIDQMPTGRRFWIDIGKLAQRFQYTVPTNVSNLISLLQTKEIPMDTLLLHRHHIWWIQYPNYYNQYWFEILGWTSGLDPMVTIRRWRTKDRIQVDKCVHLEDASMGSGTTLVVPLSQVFSGDAVLKRVILSQDRRVSPSKGGIYRRILYIHQRSEPPRVDIPHRIWFQSHIDNIQSLLPDGILKVYTDGSFVHHQAPVETIFGKKGTISTGGSVIIMTDHVGWRTNPIIAIPIGELVELNPKSVLTAEAYAILLALILKKVGEQRAARLAR